MTLAAELAALIPLLNQFAPEVIKLIHALEGSSEQDHEKLIQHINDAFDQKQNNGRPGSL